MKISRCIVLLAWLAAAGWALPAKAQFPAQGDSTRIRLMLEMHRRAETDPSLRSVFVDALLRGEVILPSLQYYYDARLWAGQDSAKAQRRREINAPAPLAVRSRLLDDKIGASAARAGLLRSADSARKANPAGAGTIEARLYATSVTLWQGLLPDSVLSTAILRKRLDAVDLRKQEAQVRAMAAEERRAATLALTGQPAGYQGGKVNGRPEGHGVLTNSVGDRLEGQFKRGAANGHAVLVAANGISYEGEFVDGTGTGVLTVDLPSGTRYVGVLTQGHRDGQGSIDLPSGERYRGGFREDLFEGRGILEYANGGRYDGEWLKGKRHGLGTEEFPEGRVLRGRFESDRFLQVEDITPMLALVPELPRQPEPEAAEPAPPRAPSPAAIPVERAPRSVVITGRVMDAASKKPLAGAAIFLNRAPYEAGSSRDGAFSVTREAPVELIVRRSGYVPFTTIVEPDRSTLGDVLLQPVKSDADRLAVQDVDIRLYPQLRSFYERRAQFRGGKFWTPDELQQAGGTIPVLLRREARFRSICFTNRQGDWDCRKTDRGPTTIMGSGQSSFTEQQECTIRVWTDDVGPEQTLDEIMLSSLIAIEAYPTPSETPPTFGASQCATVRLWTRRAQK